MAAFEVIALDTATPQLRAPGAADTYTFPRAVEMPLGTANGMLYLNGSKVVTSGSGLTFDGTEFKVNAASGNVLVQPSNVANAKLYMRHGSIANNNGFEVDSSSNTIFLQAGSEQMRLTSTGLGIGTSSPTVRLQLEQAANSAPVTLLRLNNSGTTGGGPGIASRISFTAGATALGYVQGSNFASGAAGLQFSGDGTNVQATLDASGNLGLGVTPSGWVSYTALQVASIGGALSSSSSSDFEITTNAYYNGGWLSQGAGVASTRYRLLSGSHSWWTSGTSPGVAGSPISFTQAMTLDASGNLLVGATSGSEAVEVTRSGATSTGLVLNQTGTSGRRYIIASTGAGYGSAGNLIFYDATAAAERARITSGGEFQLRSGTTDNQLQFFDTGGVAEVARVGTSSSNLNFLVGSTTTFSLRLTNTRSVVTAAAALATNATDGFLYVPTCAGTPTGTPTAQTGAAPIVVDTTNNKLYFYSGGQWRDAGP